MLNKFSSEQAAELLRNQTFHVGNTDDGSWLLNNEQLSNIINAALEQQTIIADGDLYTIYAAPQPAKQQAKEAGEAVAEARIYVEHGWICVRTETGQLLQSAKIENFGGDKFISIAPPQPESVATALRKTAEIANKYVNPLNDNAAANIAREIFALIDKENEA